MKTDFVALANELGPAFAERAGGHDANDTFVSQNYADLKAHKFFSAGVPTELGGGGAGLAELCEVLRTLGRYCSSTALALSMHTHQVAIPAWRWNNEKAPVEGLLRRIAAEELVLVSSGGSDWLDSSGRLEKVEGGYQMTARKVFSSGSPAGDMLMTSAVYDDPSNGPLVFHFPLPLHSDAVRVLDNWRTLGMRATGSNDIVIEGAFVPDAAIGLQRAKGKWHIIFHLVVMIALPLVYSVYVGIAESARKMALDYASKKPPESDLLLLVGEMENELRATQIAFDSALALAQSAKPGPETTNELLIRRTLAGNSAIKTVEKAMEIVGGASYFRAVGLERLFRDVQAARFHPMQEKRQHLHTGHIALGHEVE